MHRTNNDRKKLLNLTLLLLIISFSFGCGNDGAGSNNIRGSQDSFDTSAVAKAGNTSTNTDTSSSPGSNGSASEIANADWLLVPGKSAGQTKINENADSVYKKLGRPDGGDAAMQKAVAIWYSHHDSTAHSIAIYTARSTDSAAIARVLQIRVTSPSFTTKNGIHTSSLLTDIQSAFSVSQTETYKDAGTSYKVYDSKDGIAFEINRNNKCVAIIIHKAGNVGEGTYLKFRTTNKFIDR